MLHRPLRTTLRPTLVTTLGTTPRTTSRATLALSISLATAGFVSPLISPAAVAAAPTTPYLSELHYDNTGTDTGEFVEVTLPAGTTSTDLSLVLYNGGTGGVYDTDVVPTVAAPPDGPAVAVVDYPANGIQNGDPDAVALVRGGQVLELLSYEGSFTAVGGPAAGMTSADIGVREAGTEPAGSSLSRVLDTATDDLVWRGPAPATKGAVNPATDEPEPEPVEPCLSPPTHDVGEVQGDGPVTGLAGQRVSVRGTVVADLPGFRGFHVQDGGDGDASTSDGVFVFSDFPVDLGDTVQVTGTAAELNGQTQVSAATVEVCVDGTRDDLPDPAGLDLPAGDAERERLEGMLVDPVDILTVSEVFNLTRFGELTLSQGGRLLQPTEVARPGTAEAAAVAAANVARSLLLDDGASASTSVTRRPYLGATTPVRVGDELTFQERLVLGWGFSKWRLQPADGTADGVFQPQDTRTEAPAAVDGDVRIAAFNVLNYFLTWSGDAARGATSAEQFGRQAAKTVAAISGLDADVVTLLEVEDTDSTGYTPGNADTAVADLVARLNARAGNESGEPEWAYVPLPTELYAVERDVIRNAIIYRPARVTPVGAPVGLVDETVWANAREPIAQTFVAEDDVFTVVANHFKSKSPGNPTGDNVDTGDGQGEWNGDRVRQAQSLASFARRLQATTEDDDVVLLGDFNAYTQEDPIQALRSAGWTDLGDALDPGRYSYVFDALSGSLDHALASEALTAKVTDVTHWNINAVESFAYQYTGDRALYEASPYRSSDHDPLLLGLDLQAPQPQDHPCDGRVPTILGTNGADVLRGTDRVDVVVALGGDDEVRGLASGDDRLVGGLGADDLRQGKGSGPVVPD